MQEEPDISAEQGAALTLADGPAEAERLVAKLQEQGLSIRLLGGIAVRLRCPSARHRALDRSYADLDFVAPKKQSKALRDALTTNGYTADRRFNALHGDRRLLFFDEARSRQIDIFLDTFEMCHKLVLEQRLTLHPLTLSPADLLLTKLQIVQLNVKDIQDSLALLLDFPPVEHSQSPGNELDLHSIAQICSQDWGWFTTVNDNLDRIGTEAATFLTEDGVALVTNTIATIKRYLDVAPKSAGWRLRAVAGRRMAWYELPEEVRR